MVSKTRTSATASTKLPADLFAHLEQIALYRGVSRSWLLRELVEALADGRVALTPPNRGQWKSPRELATSDVMLAAHAAAQADAEAAAAMSSATADVHRAAAGASTAGRFFNPVEPRDAIWRAS